MALTRGEAGRKRHAPSVAHQVNLGGQTTPGTSERVIRRLAEVPFLGRPLGRIGCSATGPDARRINHPRRAVDQSAFVRFDLQPAEDAVEQAALLLAAKARVDRLPLAVALGQIAPRRPRTKDPQDSVKHLAITEARPACGLLGKEVLNQLPLRVGQFVAADRCEGAGGRFRYRERSRYSIPDFLNRA